MAEVNANSLPAKTDLGTNDSAIVVDQTTNAGALVDLDVLADKVLDRISSKTFANQVGGSSAATLLAQLSTLNSNLTGKIIENIQTTPSGTYTYTLPTAGFYKIFYVANGNGVTHSIGEYTVGAWTDNYTNIIPITVCDYCTVTLSGLVVTLTTISTGRILIYKYGV